MEENNECRELKKLPYLICFVGFLRHILNRECRCMTNGVVLVADSWMTTTVFARLMCENGRIVDLIRRWLPKCEHPANYKIGLLVLQGQKQSEIKAYLDETDFLPVVIAGGILPPYLRTGRYIFRVHDEDVAALRGAEFSSLMTRFKKYVTKNINVIWPLLRQLPTSTIWQEYQGDMETRCLYEILIATAEVVKMFVRHESDEETANTVWIEFYRECMRRIEEIPDFAGGEILASEVPDIFTEYLENHPEISVSSTIGLSDVVFAMVLQGEAILYDDEYYYLPEKLFRKVFAPFLETVSIIELKKQFAEGEIIKKTSEDYTAKKQFSTKSGMRERKRMIWFNKKSLLTEDNLALEDLFEKR